MTHDSAQGSSNQQQAGQASAANPQQLMQQLAAMFNQAPSGDVQGRIEELQAKLESLTQKLESPGASGGPAPGAGSFVISDKVLAEKFKKLLTSVLFESGVLEKLVGVTVENKLRELNLKPGGAGEALKTESARLVKEFLSQNLGTLFQSEIRGAIQKELQAFMASENMKMLIDDKFRTVQLYLTTEVIPNTVKQILRKLSQQQTA